MNINNISSGFTATGIFPFNKNIMTDYAYVLTFPNNRDIPDVSRERPEVEECNS
jgi:hypothetical protein